MGHGAGIGHRVPVDCMQLLRPVQQDEDTVDAFTLPSGCWRLQCGILHGPPHRRTERRRPRCGGLMFWLLSSHRASASRDQMARHAGVIRGSIKDQRHSFHGWLGRLPSIASCASHARATHTYGRCTLTLAVPIPVCAICGTGTGTGNLRNM